VSLQYNPIISKNPIESSMKNSIFPVISFLICMLSLFSTQAMGGKLYKWVDEHGNVSFSDQISPEEAKFRRETLSKQGRVVDITDQEKTKEQQNRENRLNQLRKKQEKVIDSQKAHDESLLRTYHSENEMRLELRAKLQPIEAQRKLIESELVQKMERLDSKQKEAATFERNAQPVPDNLVEEIKSIQEGEIERTKKSINENLSAQQRITNEYESNIKRFLVLTQTPSNADKDNKISSIEEADALGLFHCENDHQCNKAWEIARLFVDTYSTTTPDINTDKLVMHSLPSKDSDFSLSISKIASKDAEDQLFLDIHCRESSLGAELCNSKKIQELRSAFRPYVNERLSNKVPTP
jgi:hypothetical protein